MVRDNKKCGGRGAEKNRMERWMDRQTEDGGGMISHNDVFGCWLFCSDCGSYHGNLINRCPTYQQGIRLHSSVNKHTNSSSGRLVRTRRDDGRERKKN